MSKMKTLTLRGVTFEVVDEQARASIPEKIVQAVNGVEPDENGNVNIEISGGGDGANGKDGVSATHSWNGTVLTVTSASGTSSADLKGDKGDKGDTGATGATGAAGKTPVRGTDYWTPADKAEIIQAVMDSFGDITIFGVVDENNNITIKGNLADDVYNVKYEMEDGSTIDIGNLDLASTTATYSVTTNLTNCTSSNDALSVTGGESYTATISEYDLYVFSSINVTMGGVDVTSSVVNDKVINIANVTGDIVITAIAAQPTGNLADPTSSDWSTDTRLATGNGAGKEAIGCTLTNFIPAKMGDILRVKGLNINTYMSGSSNHTTIGYYKGDKTYQSFVATSASIGISGDGAKSQVSVSDNVYTYTIALLEDGTQRATSETSYIRISAALADGYTAEDVVITINEEIDEIMEQYSVTNTLTNCTTNNSATKAVEGESYSATITAKSGYVLKSVTATMGGSAVTVSGGKINIASVTGNIVITAVAEEAVYTNLFVPSGAQINKRLNSSDAVIDADGYIVTNFIDVTDKVPFTDSTKIYIKGAGFDDGGATSVRTFKTTGTSYTNEYSTTNGSAITPVDEGNGVISISGFKSPFGSGVVRAVMSLKVSDSAITTADLNNIVITIDEPIG